MKKHHRQNNNRYPPQPSVCDHPSLACDHQSAIKEIARQQSLVTQLRAIVLPALQADDRSELAAQMFQSILDCSSKAIAELQLHQSDARADDVLVDDKKRVRMTSDDWTKKEDAKPHHQHKKRRFSDSVSLETPVPHYDGHQWRKYGQKHINKAKYPRSYYRCTYKQEQDCQATKTVQRQDDGIGADHLVMYTVVYHGQHTCNSNNGDDSATNDAETNNQTSSDLVNSDSQSSISVNYSNPYDHQTSVDENKLLDKTADLITMKIMYEPFDMTAFAPLDLDSWELDALLRF
ncbi:hypothetical protein ACP70R_020198 [Stipagrostis hirtigluma subsp. patula]